jgi:single-stranded DNA-binding protein
LLEVEVLEAPQVRYTQDNQTPIAEMTVRFDGLRPEDPPGQLKVVGWGNLAQDLQSRVQVGQRLVLEGRLRMNTVTRQQDGVKEKRAELTLARLHPLTGPAGAGAGPAAAPPAAASSGAAPRRAPAGPPIRTTAPPAGAAAAPAQAPAPAATVWNSGPLVEQDIPDDDEIPF